MKNRHIITSLAAVAIGVGIFGQDPWFGAFLAAAGFGRLLWLAVKGR